MLNDPMRQPRDWFERLLWLHGRKFWIALFAGVSAFVVTVVGMWIAARVPVETGRTVHAIVEAYLWTSAGMVGVYSGTNAVVERAHAGRGMTTTSTQTQTATSRSSGTVAPPEGE